MTFLGPQSLLTLYSAGYISWYELFQIKEGLGPKHSLLGYNFGPKLKPHVVRSAKNLTAVPSTYEEVHELASKLDFFCWEFVFFHLEKVSWSLQATTIQGKLDTGCLILKRKILNGSEGPKDKYFSLIMVPSGFKRIALLCFINQFSKKMTFPNLSSLWQKRC